VPERTYRDLIRLFLVEDIDKIREIQAGESDIAYVSEPSGQMLEVTASNADAASSLLANFFEKRYPELFPDFDAASSPLPTEDELYNSTGGTFGSINVSRTLFFGHFCEC